MNTRQDKSEWRDENICSLSEAAQLVEKIAGAPGRIRTSDPQIRSLMLYPAELRARVSTMWMACGRHNGRSGSRSPAWRRSGQERSSLNAQAASATPFARQDCRGGPRGARAGTARTRALSWRQQRVRVHAQQPRRASRAARARTFKRCRAVRHLDPEHRALLAALQAQACRRGPAPARARWRARGPCRPCGSSPGRPGTGWRAPWPERPARRRRPRSMTLRPSRCA